MRENLYYCSAGSWKQNLIRYKFLDKMKILSRKEEKFLFYPSSSRNQNIRSENVSMKKRLLSIALCLCMLLTFVPTVALAEEPFVPTEQELTDAETYQKAFDQNKTWENLGNAALNYNYAKTYVAGLEEGEAKTAAQERLNALTNYYEGITKLDMSGKKGGYGGDDGRHGCLAILTNLETLDLRDTGITNVGPLAGLTNLKEVDISDNPIDDLGALDKLPSLTKLEASNTNLDSNDFGALVNKNLTHLDLSGTDITSIGPITTNGDNPTCANSLTYLDVSNTGLTQLQEVWNSSKASASLPALKNLKAQGLSLTSISGLVEIVNAKGFSADGITWDLSGSTLTNSGDNQAHLSAIAAKLPSGFTAPGVQNTSSYSLAKAEQWKNTITEQMGSDNGKAALTWQSLIFGHYWFDTAKDAIDKMSDGSDKTALTTRWNAIDTYYKSITAIDMSDKTEVPDGYAKSMGVFSIFPNLTKLDVSNTGLSDFGIGTGGANLVNLEELNLSGLTCSPDNTLFGGLSGLNSLKVLNISGITGVTDIGGLVDAGVADSITTLDISDTKVTKLESVWDETTSAFPELKNLTAHNLKLTSISGLVEIVSADDFESTDITWDLSGSTLTDSDENQAHIDTITAKLNSAFTAPTIPTTPPSGGTTGGSTGGGSSSGETYDNTAAATTNGKVTVTDAKKGETATITTTADKGYKVGTVTVKDEKGKTVSVTNAGNGKYTFTQPEGKVTVTVTFVWDNPFKDVKSGDWFYNAVQYVNLNGLMAGTGSTTFEPTATLTRAQAVQVLYNLEGQPTVTGKNTFTDVASNHWGVKAITWASANGVVAGVGNNEFDPDVNVSREQFAQMMYNYATYKKYSTSASADLTKFPDEGSVSSWAEKALAWANAEGLINGSEDGGVSYLAPAGTATRGQTASILMNFDKNIAG